MHLKLTREMLLPWLPLTLVLLHTLIEPAVSRSYAPLVVFFLIAYAQFELFKKMNAIERRLQKSDLHL